MCVASGVSITRRTCNSSRDGSTSNRRRPSANSTGILTDLQLVEHRCFECSLRRVCTMNKDVPVPSGRLGLCHCALDAVEHVRHQRVVRDRWTRRVMAGDAVSHCLDKRT